MRTKINPQRARPVIALGVAAAASSICAQTWNYEGSMNHDAPGPTVPGQMTLEGAAGEYKLYMKQTNFDPCYKSPVKATVERAPTTITITTTPGLSGCAPNRFVLNIDGTVGVREFSNGAQWRRDEAFRVVK